MRKFDSLLGIALAGLAASMAITATPAAADGCAQYEEICTPIIPDCEGYDCGGECDLICIDPGTSGGTHVPEPGMLALFGLGLGGVAFASYRRRKG